MQAKTKWTSDNPEDDAPLCKIAMSDITQDNPEDDANNPEDDAPLCKIAISGITQENEDRLELIRRDAKTEGTSDNAENDVTSVESEIEFEPSDVTGTATTHEEHDNIKLLGEVYLLVSGGERRWLDSTSTNLTQIETPMGNTLLHLAAWYGNDEVVDLVVERAPKLLFSFNSKNDSALHVAARAGHISTVTKLLHAYANPQRRQEISKEWITYMELNMNPEDYDGRMNMTGLLHLVEEQNDQGNIMLHEAMMSSNSDMGAMIFQVLEAYTTEDGEGRSLSTSCYEFALDKVNNERQSVLYLAVEAGHKEAVNRILERCPDQSATPQGLSPVVAAIMKRGGDMLSTILRKKQNWIHLKDKHERLPLHYAASIGYHEGVVYLLQQCKDCSIQRDNYGFFPLHLASHGGHLEVVKELLGYCPDPNEMLDKSGRNIIHIAAKSGKLDVVRYILQTTEHEKMINQKDQQGNTPLHLATFWCRPRIVYALTWDKRVDLNLVNQKKETALDIAFAIGRKNPSLQQLLTWTALKSAGAKRNNPRKVLRVEYTPTNNSSDQSEKSPKMAPTKDSVSDNIPYKDTDSSNQKEKSPKMAPTKDRVSDTNPYQDRVDTLIVVSTLIVTASVAACLAVPGEADGKAHNLDHAMFHFFIFSITISLFSSISATIVLIWARLGFIQLLEYSLKFATPLIGVALTTLSMAFLAGLYTVISALSWLANTFLVVSVIFVIIVVVLYILLFLPSPSTCRPLRCISYYPFIFLAWLAE